MYYATSNGIAKRIESWKIVIPSFDNQKKPFPEKVMEGIKSKIIGEFGGLTAINTVGYWKSGRQLFSDEGRIIIVDMPVKDHKRASTFFADLKDQLRTELRQEKIYVTFENAVSELLSVNEFLQELGFEIPPDQPQSITQESINKLVEQSDAVRKRLGYRTLSLIRDEESRKIIWVREILGARISTQIEDNYPADIVILPADNLETYFEEGTFGKPLVIIGDYEFQSYILDEEKRRYIVGEPNSFSKYDKGDVEPLYGPHAWHGMLRTSEFIPTFVEEILINYILLRELGQKGRINVVVGSDGSRQSIGDILLRCPAVIPDRAVQLAIIENFIKAKKLYESGTIDEIALMQAKVMNRYNEKKAMIRGSRNLMSSGNIG